MNARVLKAPFLEIKDNVYKVNPDFSKQTMPYHKTKVEEKAAYDKAVRAFRILGECHRNNLDANVAAAKIEGLKSAASCTVYGK